jgi:hypothetical protein
MASRVSKHVWIISALLGAAVAAVLLADMLTGRWLVEREALLTDYAEALEATGLTGYQHRRLWETLADTLERGVQAGALDERNRPLGAYLGARSRLHAGEEALRHNTEQDIADPRAWQQALELVEDALRMPALYLDFEDPQHFTPEAARYIEARVGGRRPTREQLAAMVVTHHLHVADRLNRRGEHEAAYRHYDIILEPRTYRDGEDALLTVLPLAARAATDPLAAEQFADGVRHAASGPEPLAREFLARLQALLDTIEEGEHLPDILLAAAEAERAGGDTDRALKYVRRVESPHEPRVLLLRAAIRHDLALRRLAHLAGPSRPLPRDSLPQGARNDLESAELEYAEARDAALQAAEALLEADDPAVRHDARLLRAGLRLDDARYGFQFLPSLDPETLRAFARPNEPLPAARRRLLAGPDPGLMLALREDLELLHDSVRFDDQPETWVAVRIRLGHLEELRDSPGRRYVAGHPGAALAEHWLPLLQAQELRGERSHALVHNRHVSWPALVDSVRQGAHHLLSLRPEGEHALEVLEALGDPLAHAEFLHAAARLDPRLGNPHELAGDKLMRFVALQAHAGQDDAADLTRRAAWYAVRAARHTRETTGFEQAGPWLKAGERFLAAGRAPEAVPALRRYLAVREANRDGPLTAEDIGAAVLLARALKDVGAHSEAIRSLEDTVAAMLPALRARNELPPQGLEAFVVLAQARLAKGMHTGDAALLEQTIEDITAQVVHASIFSAPPAGLETSRWWRDAQMTRGRAALWLADRALDSDAPDMGPVRARLRTAAAAFASVVSSFPEDREGHEALLALAGTDFKAAVHSRTPLAAPELAALRRAGERAAALARKPGLAPDVRRGALLLTADIHELLGRRLDVPASEGDHDAALESREALLKALDAAEQLDREFPRHPDIAWALGHRIACLRMLGRATPADAAAAEALLRQAASIIGRVPDDAWDDVPGSRGAAYWTEYFAWLAGTEKA